MPSTKRGPRGPRKANAAAKAALARMPKIDPAFLDSLVKGPMTPAEVQDVMLAFRKALIERTLGAEMDHHLGYAAGEDKPEDASNHRNGTSGKTVLTEKGLT